MTHQELVTTRIQNGLRLIRESPSLPTSLVPPKDLPIAIALRLVATIEDTEDDIDAAIAKVRDDPQGAEALLVMAERYRPENACRLHELSSPSILRSNDIALVGIWIHAEATTAGSISETLCPRDTPRTFSTE